jgi:hypothetical protein
MQTRDAVPDLATTRRRFVAYFAGAGLATIGEPIGARIRL